MSELDVIRARYRELLGHVPESIETRFRRAEEVGRSEAIEAIENYRRVLIYENPLDAKTQQLVHFALLIGAGEEMPAALHARGALKAGATAAELWGVCETAAITGGMPAFSRALRIVDEALREHESQAR